MSPKRRNFRHEVELLKNFNSIGTLLRTSSGANMKMFACQLKLRVT